MRCHAFGVYGVDQIITNSDRFPNVIESLVSPLLRGLAQMRAKLRVYAPIRAILRVFLLTGDSFADFCAPQ